MICNKCHQKLPEDSEFCQYCGNKVSTVAIAGELHNEDSKSVPESKSTASDDALNLIMMEQAKTTIAIMEANQIGQADHENEIDFGLVPEKPVYTLATDMVEGEREYLANLRVASNGERIKWERKGSVIADGVNGVTDIYATYLQTGDFYKTIYINMYGAKKSDSAPIGFVMGKNAVTKQPIQMELLQQAKVKGKIKYCSHCGSVIDGKTKQCTGCGRQYSKVKFKLLYVILAVFLLLGGYVGTNYFLAVSAMNDKNFIESKQYFDNLFISETIFPYKYEYVQAGILMEEGKYIEALRAFEKVGGFAVPAGTIESLKSEIYAAGQTAYRSGEMTEAKKNFGAIVDYKRSEDYLLLINCNGNSYYNITKAEDNFDKLVELIGFENAGEIILKNESSATLFLKGYWEDGDAYPHYFQIYEDDDGMHASYSLPREFAYGYFFISEGIYSVGETESSALKLFKFTIIDEDTILAYCYKDHSIHEMYRQ